MPHEQQQAAPAAPEVTRKPKIVVETADVRVVEYALKFRRTSPMALSFSGIRQVLLPRGADRR